ncbi:MAG TPA: hypothetical protein VG713_20440 [Pirellulales bacterium]|nr:hypothetical protein [Pirellulales bacterium]
MNLRGAPMIVVVVVLVASAGAGCPQVLNRYSVRGPRMLPETASLDDVVRVVNQNGAAMQSLVSTDASISATGTPALRASIALDRPRRLRVRAETTLTGQELDLGSNDELFWVWAKRMDPPAVMFCRHDQYQASAARQFLPIEPEWLVEALAATPFDPADRHSGPLPVRGGKLEIRSTRATADGSQTKITIVDAQSGWVLEQHLYDSRGARLASAMMSQHWRDPASGVTLPKRVEFQLPAAKTSFTLTLGNVQINQLDPATPLFAMPSYPGTRLVDLADPSLQFERPVAAPVSYNEPIAAPPKQARRWRLFR